jgi:NAD(P)-dependent dehydrogenase (short-subunit alcohol dehydrogenase family)
MEPKQSMSGKTCLVTGGTSGIGLETATALAKLQAEVVIVGRDRAKTQGVVDRIRSESGNSRVDFLIADLSSQSEIRRLAAEFLGRYPRLDVLINNAGAMFDQRLETVDGIEMTWALNHLAYFLLTDLLLERLKASAPARIINVASGAHQGVSGIAFDDPEFKQGYRTFRAYAQSKLANILFTRELAKRLEGTGVTANSLHPGFVNTSFFLNKGRIGKLFELLARFFSIELQDGAKTSVYLATAPEVEKVSGLYFVKSKAKTPRKPALDDKAAAELWSLSERRVQ